MEYQNIINLLYNTLNQLSKFRTKNWIEIDDDLRGVFNTNNQIKFKTSMLKSSLCDYSDVYKGTVTTSGAIKTTTTWKTSKNSTANTTIKK